MSTPKTPEERKKGKFMALTKKFLIEVRGANKDHIDVDYRRGIVWVGRFRVCEWKMAGGTGQAQLQDNKCREAGIMNSSAIRAAIDQATNQQ